jgi:phenylpropionate dioxygenase-like ring-hydroxylating dioxygenase large terminal subunit
MKDIDNRSMINDTAKQLLAYMACGGTHMADEVYTVRAADYLNPTRLQTEKEILFRKTPLVLGFSVEIPAPGDFKLHEETGVPILLTRNGQGQMKAFLNACRHRGAKLTEKPCGHQRLFTCPYHAWSYDSDGKLVALPAENLFGDIDGKTLGLVELPCVEKYGLIFVVPTPNISFDVDAFLGTGAADIAGWHFERNKLIGQRDLVTRANWKLALNTYVENYHFHVLHSVDFSYKVQNCAHHWQFGDSNQHMMLGWPSKSLENLRDRPESEWVDAHQHFSILHYIFPNTIIALYPETCSVMQVFPGDGVSDQVTKMSFYSRESDPSPEVEKIVHDRFELFYKVLQNEDYWICGNVYRNLESGLLPNIIFGRNEPALAWMHEALDQAIGFRVQPHQNTERNAV